MRSQKQLDAALELVKKPRQPNFLLIEISYNTKLVLPYEDGMKVIAALKNAELLEDSYGQRAQIHPIGKDAFRTVPMAYEIYEDIKVATLLNVTVEELHKARMQPLPETV